MKEWYKICKQEIENFLMSSGSFDDAVECIATHDSANVVIDVLFPLPVKNVSVTYCRSVNELYIAAEFEGRPAICYTVNGNQIDSEEV